MPGPRPGDAYLGTAQYYARYRNDYPQEIVERIRAGFGLDGRGRLLDLGCGTGKLLLALASLFEEVVGLDPSKDMLREADRQCAQARVPNVRFVNGIAEDIGPELGVFRLVTFGEAFHWMDRDRVLSKCHDLIAPGGGIVIAGAGGSPYGPEPWREAMWTVVKRWLGEERRNAHWLTDRRRHEEVLADSRFVVFDQRDLTYTYTRDVGSILGYLYSTSFCNRELLGDNVGGFEEDMRDALLRVNPSGLFSETCHPQYILARKPGET